MLLDVGEEGHDRGAQAILEGGVAAHRLGPAGSELLASRLHQLDEQRALGGEVVVDDGLCDPGRPRHLPHRRRVVAALREGLGGGIEDPLPPLRSGDPGGGASLHRDR
jgi:hypothetical protein